MIIHLFKYAMGAEINDMDWPTLSSFSKVVSLQLSLDALLALIAVRDMKKENM